MSKELIVSTGRHETRVAILEDDQLVEVFHEREKEYSLAGSIHKGRVTRVLPGMQSAFVDIGLERDAFLYVSDFFEDTEEYDALAGAAEEKVLKHIGKGPRVGVSEERPPVESEQAEIPAPATVTSESEESAAAKAVDAVSDPAEQVDTPGQGRPVESESRRREGNERGRRRRGRRRSGRGPGGLPDSKYFSPGTDRAEKSDAAEPDSAAPEMPEADAPEPVERLVLPGESLAKYSRSENRATQAPSAAPAETPAPEGDSSSLTAELREHGQHLSNRLSRRSRRRGGRNRGNRPPAQAGGESPAEEAVDSGEASESEAPEVSEAAQPTEAAVPAPEVGQDVAGSAATPEQPRAREDRRGGRDRGKERGRGNRSGKSGEAAGGETNGRGRDRDRESDRERTALPSISDLLKERQEIIVQISKEPIGQKGARITSHIALPGRFVVYMPTVDHAGVSRKIPSEEERHRLKRILQTHRQGIPGGFICRTAATGQTEEDLRADMHFLYNLWLDLRQKAEKRPAPLLLHHDLDLVQRILRDQLTTSFKTIWVDTEEQYVSILKFVERFQPALVGRVKLYTRPNPIFDEFGVSAELEKALRPKVWLKSGGYIVINQTEALVAIDINTGKYVGKSSRLEDTIVRVNTDAVKEIVRQIRLRDLGGIIVVDFIDMDERKNRQKVMQALEEAMRVDRAPYKILQFNDFGLVAITRKRVKQSLERTLCAPCSYCEGAGYVKSPQTVITEILAEAQRMKRAVAEEKGNVMLRVNPEVAKVLKSNHNSYLQEIEEILARTVMVKSDPSLHQTKFDLA